MQLSTECVGVLPQNFMDLANLDMLIEAARAGAGNVLTDRNMIECELATSQLVPINPTTMTGPYTNWLDVTHDQISRSRVARFSR
ncbi:hypothetical protein [Leisingera sp.]|uniref:hypothetical protein n=1 Tax=Leisingera sp. TaxID=1879318 RepID=UPI003A91F240